MLFQLITASYKETLTSKIDDYDGTVEFYPKDISAEDFGDTIQAQLNKKTLISFSIHLMVENFTGMGGWISVPAERRNHLSKEANKKTAVNNG